jgi:hypothetical protein
MAQLLLLANPWVSVFMSRGTILKIVRSLVAILATTFCLGPVNATPIAGFQGTWQTTLQARDLDRDGVTDAFYDTSLNITWLKDNTQWHYAETVRQYGFNAYLRRDIEFTEANRRVRNLDFGGVTGWRLTNVNDTNSPGCNFSYAGTDCGWNVDTSTGNPVNNEFAHLFYVTFGNMACQREGVIYGGGGFGDCGTRFWGEFDIGATYDHPNVVLRDPRTDQPWTFSLQTFSDIGSAPFGGFQRNGNTYSKQVIVVHDGDVGALTASVPLPSTFLLLALAAFGLTFAKRESRSGL